MSDRIERKVVSIRIVTGGRRKTLRLVLKLLWLVVFPDAEIRAPDGTVSYAPAADPQEQSGSAG